MNQFLLKKITQNKRAYHEFFIEKILESGIALLGWEVKAARSNMVNINNSYVSFYNKEAYIYNSVFQSNIMQVCDKINNSTRIRKLLLNKNELLLLTEKVNQQRYTIIILDLYWKNSWIKVNIGIAKGKKKHDKRNAINTQKWQREKIKIIKRLK